VEPYFDVAYELRHFEMNRFGEASPTIMLALLEEAAAEHCYAIDHSLYQLLDRNIGWVLSSGLLRMERFPRYKGFFIQERPPANDFRKDGCWPSTLYIKKYP
jgi:medium-chain acyl-[acyl-carrier-protein] hydrolase